MAVASERLVVLMTPAEKRRLEAKARRLGASAGELVRRSVKAYDAEADDRQVETLLRQLAEAHTATLAALDRAERELAATRAYFAGKRSGP
jgi:phage gp37-like protein